MTLRDESRELRDIPLGLIDPPRLASRATMDESSLDDLTANVRLNGVISPLSVGRVGDRYEVVAGHRRSIAAKRAGLVTVPCVVYPSIAAAHEAIKFAENRYREDLNPAEEAIWFAELLDRDCGGDVDRLCEQLGIKRGYAEGRLALFQGDRDVFNALQENRIGIGVAQELNRCPNEGHRRYLLQQAIAGGATRSVVAGWLLDYQKNQALIDGVSAAAPVAMPSTPIPESNYFTCYVCKGSENIHAMRPINVHDYCTHATLTKALDQFQRRGEQLAYPRTVDEARTLITDLLATFPELVN